MGLEIREMVIEDIQKVRDVAEKSWASTYEDIIPSEIQKDFLKGAYSDQMLARRIEFSNVFVAEQDNKLVGFANFSQVDIQGQAILSAIYIYENYQGKGIGSALLQAGIDQLRYVSKIFVDVEKDNDIGKTFYEAKGFKIFEEFEDKFNGYPLKTLRMSLTL